MDPAEIVISPPIRKKIVTGVPEKYLDNPQLQEAISILPRHYNFQIQKTLHRIDSLAEQLKKDSVSISLQFPEGLMVFACVICDILTAFATPTLSTIIMGDVTYGACCIDDIASDTMGCDLLVHYGHSCLVPITETRRKVLYVFVEIQIDLQHFVDTFKLNFNQIKGQPIYLMGTIQFTSALFQAKVELVQHGFNNLVIPQEKPRSGGEVLGCTSPKLPLQETNIIVFLCDGRFHMEAAMIANPEYTFFQYDPYSRQITEEKYATHKMLQRRGDELERAASGKTGKLCLIFGALGRQGNTGILDRLISKVQGHYQYMVLIASEITTELLTLLDVDFFVQIACPRLSIDWSYGTPKPLLTPFELFALIDRIDLRKEYRMDYYSNSGGPWGNFYGKEARKKQSRIKLQLEGSCAGCKGECGSTCVNSPQCRK